MNKICPICNKQFKTYSKKQVCCSMECGGISRWNKRGRTRQEKKCKICGKEFYQHMYLHNDYYNSHRGKYCSRECWLIGHKAEIKCTCVICGKNFAYHYGYKGSSKYCCFDCASKGKANEWKVAKEAALFRDKYKCQECGIKQGTIKYGNLIKLEVHHKDETGSNRPKKEMNNDLDNLITYCHFCHMKEELKLKGGSFSKGCCDKTKRNNEIYDLLRSGKSQTEISKIFNITRQRVNQIIYRIASH